MPDKDNWCGHEFSSLTACASTFVSKNCSETAAQLGRASVTGESALKLRINCLTGMITVKLERVTGGIDVGVINHGQLAVSLVFAAVQT